MKTSKEFKIGLVTIITLAFAILGLNFLKGKNLLSPTEAYYIVYDDVANLKESAYVNIYGMKVGVVGDLETQKMDGRTRVLVKLLIDKGLNIPDDSYAELYDFDLLGTKAIRLIAGQSTVAYENGDTIPSHHSPGLSEKMDDILVQVESVLGNLDTVTTQINKVFNNENAVKIDSTISNLSDISKSVNEITAPGSDLNQAIHALNNTMKVIDRNNRAIESTIQNMASFSDSLSQIHLAQLVDSTMQAISEAHLLLSNINNGTGTIGKMAQNDSLYNNLTHSTESLNNLLIDLKENPKSYVHFSLFGK